MIIEAKEKDSKVLAKMAKEIWENDNILELEKEFEKICNDKNSTCFIKYVEDNPVGFANVTLRHDYVEGTETSPVGYLEGIYVKENFRNRGYAKELVKSCEEWSKVRGCREFASDCLLNNVDSFKFHIAIGFTEANRIICFRKDL